MKCITLKGVDHIKKVFLRRNKIQQYDEQIGRKTVKEWVLDTEGCNLLEVLAKDFVDPTRTTSNNITFLISMRNKWIHCIQ